MTSRHLAFTPNYLAALFGRRSLVRLIGHISASVETVMLGFPLGEIEVVRVSSPQQTLEAPVVLFVQKRADELRAAIDKARYWG